jgi:excisionase family DNA binding protein
MGRPRVPPVIDRPSGRDPWHNESRAPFRHPTSSTPAAALNIRYLSPTWTYAMHPQHDHHLDDDDRLLTPREVAELFGVRTTTIARWSRDGRLPAFLTPGGHRRYRLPDVRALLNAEKPAQTELERQTAEDAVRLYDQGWSIRQVAEKFDLDYSTMRRILERGGVRFRRQGYR